MLAVCVFKPVIFNWYFAQTLVAFVGVQSSSEQTEWDIRNFGLYQKATVSRKESSIWCGNKICPSAI